MLKRVLADRRQAEDEQAAPATPVGDAPYSVAPDPGERRLAWLMVAVVIAVVVVLAATLSRLPGLWGSPDPSTLRGVPVPSWAGDAPSAGYGSLGPAGSTPTGSVAALPVGGPGSSAGAPGGRLAPGAASATGGSAAPSRAGATVAAPGGATQPGTTAPAATEGPEPTVGPVPPDVQAALDDLSAAIRQQIDTGQIDPVAGYDLLGKIHQVGREVSEDDWSAARYYADRIREKARKYREDGRLTSTGYQALIARLDVLDDALS